MDGWMDAIIAVKDRTNNPIINTIMRVVEMLRIRDCDLWCKTVNMKLSEPSGKRKKPKIGKYFGFSPETLNRISGRNCKKSVNLAFRVFQLHVSFHFIHIYSCSYSQGLKLQVWCCQVYVILMSILPYEESWF